jgi:hypothetical protein
MPVPFEGVGRRRSQNDRRWFRARAQREDHLAIVISQRPTGFVLRASTLCRDQRAHGLVHVVHKPDLHGERARGQAVARQEPGKTMCRRLAPQKQRSGFDVDRREWTGNRVSLRADRISGFPFERVIGPEEPFSNGCVLVPVVSRDPQREPTDRAKQGNQPAPQSQAEDRLHAES